VAAPCFTASNIIGVLLEIEFGANLNNFLYGYEDFSYIRDYMKNHICLSWKKVQRIHVGFKQKKLMVGLKRAAMHHAHKYLLLSQSLGLFSHFKNLPFPKDLKDRPCLPAAVL
jgi:hypothetical protein